MRAFLVALIFAVMFVSCCYMASKGYKGTATSRAEGYGKDVPDSTISDPERRKRANDLVAFWGTLSAVLCVPPIVYAMYIAFDPEGRIPFPMLIALAVYGMIINITAGYPLERIKQ